MHHVTFVLSTGRCGTQWLTEALREALGTSARVEHEPLHNDYAPRRMLGLRDPAAVGGRPARRIAEHVATIEQELASRDYIETGHPCWGALPWLIERFRNRIRIIHLVRHPVPTAISWLSHRAFIPPLVSTLPSKELIAPADAGVAFPEYTAQWSTLSAYEKCLYYWAEVNALGLNLESQVPSLRVRYEDLFAAESSARRDVFAFLGADHCQVSTATPSTQIDRHQFMIESWPDLRQIERHPAVRRVAEALGYDPLAFDAAKLADRFAVARNGLI